jgi:hypothetical protein
MYLVPPLIERPYISACNICTNKTDRHDIAEIFLKVALNTIKPNYAYKGVIYGINYCVLGKKNGYY